MLIYGTYSIHFGDFSTPHSHVARMEESRSDLNILTDIPVWKIPLGRSRCRWEDNMHDVEESCTVILATDIFFSDKSNSE